MNDSNILNSDTSAWSQIEKRLNLQSIGEFVRSGADVRKVDKFTFRQREEDAYTALLESLNGALGEETTKQILSVIENYVTVCENIYFSLGMKVGSQIMIKLTDNLEIDY